jgi:hypothetical protein
MARFEGEMSTPNEPSYASPALISLFKFLRKDMNSWASYLAVDGYDHARLPEHYENDDDNNDDDPNDEQELYTQESSEDEDSEDESSEHESLVSEYEPGASEPDDDNPCMLWVAHYLFLATHRRSYHIARLMYGLMSLVPRSERAKLYDDAMHNLNNPGLLGKL